MICPNAIICDTTAKRPTRTACTASTYLSLSLTGTQCLPRFVQLSGGRRKTSDNDSTKLRPAYMHLDRTCTAVLPPGSSHMCPCNLARFVFPCLLDGQVGDNRLSMYHSDDGGCMAYLLRFDKAYVNGSQPRKPVACVCCLLLTYRATK